MVNVTGDSVFKDRVRFSTVMYKELCLEFISNCFRDPNIKSREVLKGSIKTIEKQYGVDLVELFGLSHTEFDHFFIKK